MHIKESDWKKLRQLKEVALDRLCASILAEIGAMVTREGQTNHQRFLSIYRHIHDRNADIAEAFDNLRRSTAVHQLASMRAQGLVTDEELAQFSEETRSGVESLADYLYKR